MDYPRIIIGAAHSGAGKTTITNGLILALSAAGLTVQAYKVGPDYIDPGFHTLTSGRPGINLDPVLMGPDALAESVHRNSENADISIIEGVMGLYDGFAGSFEDREDFGSTAHVSQILGTPVILCIDGSSTSRSAAAVALGFQQFDPRVRIAGIILNKISSLRHYELVREPIEKRTGIRVLGYLPKDKRIGLPERHLGLVPAWEGMEEQNNFDHLKKLIETYIDLNGIIEIGASCKGPTGQLNMAEKRKDNHNFFISPRKSSQTGNIKIGYPYDDGFHFYYHDNLQMFRSYGAELVPFSPISDAAVPDGVSGLYFGGGYPELKAAALEKNRSMRQSIRAAADRSMPIYGECGGLMYMMERLIDFDGEEYEMAGIFSGAVKMEKKLSALGYYRGKAGADSVLAETGWSMWGHVFHWSTLIDVPSSQRYAFTLEKNSADPISDGLVYKNVLASYFHVHFAGGPEWLSRFIDKCIEYEN